MSEEFVTPGKPVRHYRVSMPDGSKPAVVTVEHKPSFKRVLQRHVEQTRELGDGKKKTDLVLTDVEHEYDFESEMKLDAVRAYNNAGQTSFASKQLLVERCHPDGRPLRRLKPGEVLQP